jgi:two-component system, sensor histidine kinase RegB
MVDAMASQLDVPSRRRSDKPGPSWLQPAPRPEIGGAGDGRIWDWAQARRGLRLRTLVLLRWAAILGQLATVLWVAYGLHYHVPVLWCVLVIAGAAWMNLSVTLSWPGVRLAGEREAALQLAFDIVELAVLLDLTGGLQNPFCLLMIAPPTVAAATLPVRYPLGLAALALVATVGLGLVAAPLPWAAGETFDLPRAYLVGEGVAVAAGVLFTVAYAWQAAAEAQRMELALAATQAVLAREQRLSALGGLAAAAAHELGTPLATIQVVTKEMARSLEAGPLAEDVQLLIAQAERCRAILKKLSQAPDTSDAHHARMGLSQLLDEIAKPYEDEVVLIDRQVSCAPGAAILEVRRLPEVMHGLSAFVENATDFANSVVELTAYYDGERLQIDVRDDGPGFPPEVLSKLGQPYVTTRSHGEGSRSSHHGMGLGFFIAKTLLERTGATVEFRNAKQGGAVISSRWRRDRIEAPEPL